MRPAHSGLAVLSAGEIAFLAAPAGHADGFADRLGRALAAMLSARLRLPVALTPAHSAAAGETAAAHPVWHLDDAWVALWLARRLGGQRAAGRAPFVPRGLTASLDATLAERWIEGPGEAPAGLAWRIDGAAGPGRLTLALPAAHDMTHWTRETLHA